MPKSFSSFPITSDWNFFSKLSRNGFIAGSAQSFPPGLPPRSAEALAQSGMVRTASVSFGSSFGTGGTAA